MRICFVVAVAEGGVIGYQSGLPWHLSADLRFFKRTTMGKPLLMGRKTFDTIGRPLPGRDNIVITRNRELAAGGIEVVHSVDAGLDLAAELAADRGVDEIMVIGGAQIYAQAFSQTSRMYITEIHAKFDGDTRFPEWDRAAWKPVERLDFQDDGAVGFDYSFVTYDRRVCPV